MLRRGEVLQLREEPFDKVSLAIQPCAEVWFRPPVNLGRDIGERPLLAERCPDTIGIVGLVRQNDRSSGNTIEQTVSDLSVMGLLSGRSQPDRKALPVDDRVGFGREPTSGATKTMI